MINWRQATKKNVATIYASISMSQTSSGWWLTYRTHLKNMSSSVGMMRFPIYGKIKNVPNHQPELIDVGSICHLLFR
jgi:predicted  nucleic acid-binding Zn ribbon protein